MADIHEEAAVAEKIRDLKFDVVADFIVFDRSALERDYRLFAGKTKQYIFISSASAYQKPSEDYLINESTPLINPYWEYSRKKIECEDYLMKLYREEGFPVTIVRPSHTFDERNVPVGVEGRKGCWQILKRMLEGKEVIIQGDGTSLWTTTFNTDFAPGFIGLLGNPHTLGQAVQIMSSESMTWNQIYETIADELGVELHAVHISTDFLMEAAGDQYDFQGLIGDKSNTVVFDISKLKHFVPSFEPKLTMAQGLRRAVRSVLNTPEYQREDPEFDAWCDKVIAARRAALELLK